MPSRAADSGMMLSVVPAVTWAIVITAGSNTLTWRVTIVWSAITSSAAIVIGSSARMGWRRGRRGPG